MMGMVWSQLQLEHIPKHSKFANLNESFIQVYRDKNDEWSYKKDQKGMARKAERWQNHAEWLIPIAALGCPVLCAGLDCGVSHSWGKSKDSPAAAPDKARGYSVTQESNS